jgi:pyruvate dehydrogenase E2 component (dihydrolipoamide acetyltransferase)
MATEIKLPTLGENVEEGTITNLLVAVGDEITEEQPILELDTEKAAVEVPASASGTVKEIHVKAGDTVKVGDLLLTLENGEKSPEETEETEETQTEDEEEVQEEPEVEEAEPEAQASEEEAQEEPEIRKETPKKPAKKPAAAKAPEPKAEAKPATETEPVRDPLPAAPSVHRLARELGLDLNEISGSGLDGRISEADVKNFARSIILGRGNVQPTSPPQTPLPDFAQWGEIERQPMSGVRRKTAEHTRAAWAAIPHVTHFDQADITELEELRKRFTQPGKEGDSKLTITAIVLKVVAAALKTFPQINVSVDTSKHEIIYKKYIHLGVAVDTERGLLVPVIRDVNQKNITELAAELNQLAEKARGGKLSLEEMRGSTFTVTNLGGIGGTGFTPIVNAPDAAILGLARASVQPVFKEETFAPRLRLPLALSYDHRVIDGADAARFLRWIAQALEEPFLLTLQG